MGGGASQEARRQSVADARRHSVASAAKYRRESGSSPSAKSSEIDFETRDIDIDKLTKETAAFELKNGEFCEIGIVDVLTKEFHSKLPIAPYSFSRPPLELQNIIHVPCIPDDVVLTLPNEMVWAERFKKRQLYRQEDPSSKWRLFNDSPDLTMTVTFMLPPDSRKDILDKIRVLAQEPTVRRRGGNGEFIQYIITVDPLQTVTPIDMTGVPKGAFMVSYTAADVSVEFLEEERTRSLARWTKERDDLRQALFGKGVKMQGEAAVAYCVKNNILFVDNDFTPENAMGDDVEAEDLFTDSQLGSFRRPSWDLLPVEEKQLRLFRPPPGQSPDQLIRAYDLRFGPLVAPSILCALCALCDFASRVRELFRHPISPAVAQTERSLGIYRAMVCLNGWWHEIIMDDFLPVAGGKYHGARSRDPCELWVPMLEKALAKARGRGYVGLHSLTALDVMDSITGCPHTTFSSNWAAAQTAHGLNSEEAYSPMKKRAVTEPLEINDAGRLADASTALFYDLRQHLESNRLVVVRTPFSTMHKRKSFSTSKSATFGTEKSFVCLQRSSCFESAVKCDGDTRLIYDNVGLQLGRTYRVLQLLACPGGRLLLEVSGTWGRQADGSHHAWKGSWRWGDELWMLNPEVATICGVDSKTGQRMRRPQAPGAPENTFFMDWNDALKYFSGCGVAFSAIGWTDVRVKGEFKGMTPSIVLQVRVRRTIELILALALEDDEDDEHVMLSVASTVHETSSFSPANDKIGKMQSFNLVCNSTGDVARPCRHRFSFQPRRCAMNIKLHPSGSPYLIIPRIVRDEDVAHSVRASAATQMAPGRRSEGSQRTPYHLSVLGNCAGIGENYGIEISMKQLDPDCRVFLNVEQFTASANVLKDARPTEYQVLKDGVLMSRTGIAIEDQ